MTRKALKTVDIWPVENLVAKLLKIQLLTIGVCERLVAHRRIRIQE